MAADQMEAFGALLRRHRVTAGLTQEALAERAHLSARAISDLERGVKHTPRHDTLALLAEALQLAGPARAAFEAAGRGCAAPPAARSPAGAQAAPSNARPPLVGRSRELALLERHLAGEGPPVLQLAGEPGIGKSRLLQEAAQRAPGAGLRVLQGGCRRRGGQEPYAPLLEALKDHIQGQTPVHLRAALRGCAWLVRLLPELAAGPIAPLPAWILSPEQERRLMFEAAARFLANVAGPAGTLLVLDDLQWAGSDALDLLATLVRNTAQTPLRVVGVYRDTEVGPEDSLSVTLADLAHAGLAMQCALGPLTLLEAGQLLDSVLGGLQAERTELRERVLQRAGGVPFFVVSSAQWLSRGELAAGAQDAVPWDMAQGIRQRVAALPAAAREVLGAAAVIGRVVPPALLTTVAGQLGPQVLVALEGACRARLLIEEGHAYHFAHDVIREVVEADVGIARRMVLHRRVAEALEQRPGEPAVELLAYHYSQSGEPNKPVRYLELAGDRARGRQAHVAAEGYYRDLVDRLDALGRAHDAARAREKLGGVLTSVGRYEAALEVLERAVEMYRRTADLDGLGRAVAQIGEVHVALGRMEEGVTRLQPLLERLEAANSSRGLAAASAALASLYWLSGRAREAVAAAARAGDLARALGDRTLLATAEERRAQALMTMVQHREEAVRAAEQARRVAEEAGALEILGIALADVAMLYMDRGEFAPSREYWARAREVALQQGDPLQIACTTQNSGELAYYMGDWSQARVDLERAVAMTHPLGSPWGTWFALFPLGQLCLAEGDWEAVSRYVEEARTIAEHMCDSLGRRREAQRLLAERDLLQGQPAAARSRLVPLLGGPGVDETDVAVLALLAWAHLELGELAEAEQVGAEAIARMRADNDRLDLVDALRVQAMVATRQERWPEAEQALEEGLALARSMPCPYAEGRLLHVCGEMHAQKGAPGLARKRLEAALTIFRRLGARQDAAWVEQAITDLEQP